MSGKQFTLKEPMTQQHLQNVIKKASMENLKYTFEVDLCKLYAEKQDADVLTFMKKLKEIYSRDNLYEIIGCIVVENIDIESVNIFIDDKLIAFYREYIWFNGTEKELQNILDSIGISCYHWV